MKQTPQKKDQQPRAKLGYVNVRISKKAHQELIRRANAESRTLISQLNVILKV